jgi:hypothetical protein
LIILFLILHKFIKTFKLRAKFLKFPLLFYRSQGFSIKEREEYNTRNDKINIIKASMIALIITNKNKVRMHEIVIEMQRPDAIDKFDAEELLACCEAL